MILNVSASLENNMGIPTADFSIKTSAAAFKIISNSLYENKERAVLRELSANALDAHIAVGKEEVPIQITLPTQLEPQLVIQDFGIGMSYDTVTKILTSYFNSTKNIDNTQVGGFGLGFKSPFAITESYTVITIHNGLKTELVAMLDEGMPKYLVVTKELPVDEEDGTTVSVPVSDEDKIDKLHNEVVDLFKYWDVLPEINSNKVVKEDKNFLKNTNGFLANKFYWGRHDIPTTTQAFNQVLVGPFVYDVPKGLLVDVATELALDDTFIETSDIVYKTVLSHMDACIATQVGELELAPSRERIEHTEHNKQILLQMIKNFVSTLARDLKPKIEETLRILHKKLMPLNGTLTGIPREIQKTILDTLLTLLYNNEEAVRIVVGFFTLQMYGGDEELYNELRKKVITLIGYADSLYNHINIDSVNNRVYKAMLAYTLHDDGGKMIRTLPHYGCTKLKDMFSLSTDTPILCVFSENGLSRGYKSKLSYNLRHFNGIDLPTKHCTFKVTTDNYLEIGLGNIYRTIPLTSIKEVKAYIANYLPNKRPVIVMTEEEASRLLKKRESTKRSTRKSKPTNPCIGELFSLETDNTLRENIVGASLYETWDTSNKLLIFKKRTLIPRELLLGMLEVLGNNGCSIFVPTPRERSNKRYKKFIETHENVCEVTTSERLYEFMLGGEEVVKYRKLNAVYNKFSTDLPNKYLPEELQTLLNHESALFLAGHTNVHAYPPIVRQDSFTESLSAKEKALYLTYDRCKAKTITMLADQINPEVLESCVTKFISALKINE